MKTTRSLLLAFCAAAAFASADATTVVPPTFDELVGRAELIFQGTVSEIQSQWTGEGGQRHIVTYVTFRVEDTLKGNPGASYTLRMLGGTVGDQTMEVTDTPKFKKGDRDILFVENNGTQFIPLVGIMHGRFHVQKDAQTGAEIVVNNHGESVTDLAQLGKTSEAAHFHGPRSVIAVDAAAGGSAPIRPADLKAAITTKLASHP